MMRSSPIQELPIELAVVEFCEIQKEIQENVPKDIQNETTAPPTSLTSPSLGLLTLDKLTEHWSDVIATLKTYNHSVSGVLRSSRPKAVGHGIVTIEAFYPFHKEKLSEPKTKEVLAQTFKKLFGAKVKVEIVLGKK